jgi:putative nucleotidyltransferase with HDIG domain
MTTGDRPREPVLPSGTSRELDQLTDAFNSLLSSVAVAEAEAEATYLGAVRALAAALDARDPYTAGHSERVSTFAVAIGDELRLDADARETLRLGALLHDIGKIGVPDEILRKAGALTELEFESIKAHPSAGARILRSIPFLSPHIPIVELHHERPDGRGYPYGLRGDDIPLAARIVHVADAFDAMTSARAYRSGRLPVEAVAELRRCIGTDFDGPAVEGLIAALPRLAAAVDPVSGSSMEEHWGRSRGTARGRWSREADRTSNVVETIG